MEPKKNPNVDLEKKRGLYLQIGIIISLLLVLGAFEFRTYEKAVTSLGDLIIDNENQKWFPARPLPYRPVDPLRCAPVFP